MKLDADIQALIDDGLEEEATKLETVMKNTVHVRSGALRDSITKEKIGDDWYVGVDADQLEGDSRNKSGVDYSKYYYGGQRSWAGHKFLEEAMNAVGD